MSKEPTQRNEEPHFVVIVSSGVVQEVLCDVPARIVVLDRDVLGDSEEMMDIEGRPAYVGGWTIARLDEAEKSRVHAIFNTVDTFREDV